MNKKDIKHCVLIYNPVSTGFKEENINLIAKTVKEYGITPEICKSMYQGHLPSLIKQADNKKTLIITLGGDGTVSEAYKAFNEINQKSVYAHIPTGTTNDMAKNFDVIQKKANLVVEDILNGEIVMLDSFKANDEIAAYTCVFGHLAHIPYVTNPYLKKYLGHAGYVVSALNDLMKKPQKYQIQYQTDDNIENCECILGAISNSKGFAGVDLFPNAKLDDGKIEFIFIKNIDSKLIANLFKAYLKNEVDLNKYKENIITGCTSNIKINFNDNYPKYPFDIDGEKSNILPNYKDSEVSFELAKQIRVLKRKSTNS